MSNSVQEGNHRLLVIDDNRAIHEDIRKILAVKTETAALDAMEAELFGEPVARFNDQQFEVDSADQGQKGLELVQAALREGRPYSVAIVDMRMPPGWDGVETIERMWRADPNIQVVICTAYSGHSWSEIADRLETKDRLLILKKPFDNIEIKQLVHALSQKWALQRALVQDNEARYRALYDDNPAMLFVVHREFHGQYTVGEPVRSRPTGL